MRIKISKSTVEFNNVLVGAVFYLTYGDHYYLKIENNSEYNALDLNVNRLIKLNSSVQVYVVSDVYITIIDER